jgi:hypothetical protein
MKEFLIEEDALSRTFRAASKAIAALLRAFSDSVYVNERPRAMMSVRGGREMGRRSEEFGVDHEVF